MSNVTNVQNQQPVMQNQQVHTTNEATVPAALQNAKPSVCSAVCRVLGAIFSLGISEGVLAICRHFEKNAAQVRGAAEALPVNTPTVAMQNHALSEQFKKDTLPPEFNAAVSEAFSELRANYGEKALPEGLTVQELAANSTANNSFAVKTIINEVARAIQNAETEIFPQDLKNCILEKAGSRLAALAAQAFILEQSPTISDDCNSQTYNELLKTPGFEEQLAACKNAEEVRTCLLNHPEFADTLEYFTGFSEYTKKTIQNITSELAKITGRSLHEVQEQLNLAEVNSKFGFASNDTKEIKNVKERLAQLNEKIKEIAAKFIQTKTDLYTSIASLTVSEGLKEQLRNDVLNESTLKKGYVFSRAAQAVSQVNVSSLIRVLQEGNAVSDMDLTGMFKAVAIQLSEAINTQYSAEEIADLGGDGNAITMSTACQILLDNHPEIVGLLKQYPDKIDKLIDMFLEQKYEVDEQLGREDDLGTAATRLHAGAIFGGSYLANTIQNILQSNVSAAESLTSDTIKGAFAQIMHDTLAVINAEYGVNIGTNLNEVAGLPFGKDVIDNIKNRIAAQNQLLSSAQFAEIVRSELQAHVANLAAKTAISERCEELGLNAERIGIMFWSLKTLYPALQESINNADSKEMIQALLLSCDKYENVLRRESAVAEFSKQIFNDTLSRLALLLNIDAADVEKTMNLMKLEDSFANVHMDITNEGNASEDGSVTDIQTRYQGIADRFVASKSDLLALVNRLDISPEMRANWLNEVNRNIGLKSSVLQAAYDIGHRMNGSSLLAAIKEGASQEELQGLVQSLSAQVDEIARQVFTGEEFDNLDPDAYFNLTKFARDVFWETNPELRTLVKNNLIFENIRNTLAEENNQLIQRLSKFSNFNLPEAVQIKIDLTFNTNAQNFIYYA